MKTMTYNLTFSGEIETSGVAIPVIKNAFRENGILGCKVERDASNGVDAEVILPVYANCQTAREHLISVCAVLARVGCRV